MRWMIVSLIVLGACAKTENKPQPQVRDTDCRCKPHCKVENAHCGCRTACGCRQ